MEQQESGERRGENWKAVLGRAAPGNAASGNAASGGAFVPC